MSVYPRKSQTFLAGAAVLAAGWVACAQAADLPMVSKAPPAPPPVAFVQPEGTTWDLRFGVAGHGVGSHEHDTVDLMGEVLTPRLPFFQESIIAQYLMPRLHGGGSVNLSGRTSFGYAGLAWTWPIYRGIFFEPFIDAAVHSGSNNGSPTLSALGCNYLFHAGASIGYHIDAHWSVLGTFEHLSNGKQLFGIDCGSNQNVAGSNGNQGLNNYALKVGYSF